MLSGVGFLAKKINTEKREKKCDEYIFSFDPFNGLGSEKMMVSGLIIFNNKKKYEKLFGPSNEKLYIKIKDYFSHKNMHDFHFTENICADSLTRENICADSFSPEEKSIEYS